MKKEMPEEDFYNMKKNSLKTSFWLLSILLILGCSNDEETIEPVDDQDQTAANRTVVSNLSVPWEMLWGPDDFLWVTERGGRVNRIDPETGERVVIADLTGTVEQSGESGLLGMALHPDFSSSPFVYLVYTYRNGSSFNERLARFTYTDGSLGSETILLDNIPAGSRHNGSRIVITPESFILMTTGDIGNSSLSQDVNSLVGKLLRLNLDGGIPSDNPDPNSYVYSIGHRNAQGLMVHPNGMIYSSEHGPSSDDEINITEAGGNYGWPNVLGTIDTPDENAFALNTPVVESIIDWTPTIAPSDIMWYPSDQIPEWTDRLLLASLREQTLFAITLSEDGRQVVGEQRYFEREFGRIRDIVMAPDGRLFIATNGSSFSDNSNTHSIIEINRLSD
ncbi:PQQ-dependent sugar dehydrogenase [Tunicatimonas pelagia]|uniref:PQQ-dependent sugar dehydrogenase n=1 Tax=Tunicatimonas pelagia TaxID=931531 RepID=UPI002666A559|nr:PQQ-dependent sugar dehydrogenase [Tunicatimonas pelagia]WKN44838.1 PQQ-dependent sugar dehydrogenase [Tunicatimonas pelagia]